MYYNFGFKFMFENDHIDVKYNYNKLKNINTGYILFDKLIHIIKKAIKKMVEKFLKKIQLILMKI